jgi:putative membrane protein
MMGWSGGWHAMIFGPLFMILFLAVLVAVVGWPWQGVIQPHRFPPVRTPLDMLIAHTETLKVGAIGR